MSDVTETPTLKLLNLGAGVQSTTLALLAVEGVLEKPDGAIFADTGWEPAAVYAQLERVRGVLDEAGIPLHVVSNGNLRNDALDPDHRYASIPYFIRNPEGACTKCDGLGGDGDGDQGCTRCKGTGKEPEDGQGRRQCTSEYKLAPINRKVRELLGAEPPDYRRVPRGRVAEQWIGFSTDEVHRVDDKRHVRYAYKRHPLLELNMSRKDCIRFLESRGWSATKSACIGCPYHGNRAWRDLRDNHPEEWDDAIAFDAAIRKGGSRGDELRGTAFLHRSRVPLALAPIDRVTSREWHDRQVDLLDVIAEDGDPDGCSPYGCRSGAAVE
jgi:hypothetical protein